MPKVTILAATKDHTFADYSAEQWLGNPAPTYLQARGKSENVTIRFATGGTPESPTSFTNPVNLGTSWSNVPAAYVQAAINAGLKYNGTECIAVEVSYNSDPQFEVKIGDNAEDNGFELPS